VDVCVLTPVFRPEAEHLRDAWDSVRRQEEVAWRWVLQVDGSESDLEAWIPAALRGDDRVSAAANGVHMGTSTTRNLGLVRCEAELVQQLDQDDLLLDGALTAGVRTLRADEELAFCFGELTHMHPDGSTRPAEFQHGAWSPGRIEPGEIEERLREGRRAGVPNTAVMWRKRHLLAYGGWAAIPYSEDAATIFAVAQRHPAAFFGREAVCHRLHAEQAYESPNARRTRDWQRAFLRGRLEAMHRVIGGEDPPPGPWWSAAPGPRRD
jgi:hypothetical protein